MWRPTLQTLRPLFLAAVAVPLFAQPGDEAMRVTVTMNPDGSKTVAQTDQAKHQSIVTTTAADGKVREKIIYRLDADGRYESGEVFAANGALRFKTLYKYDAAGRLAEETQLAKDGLVLDRIVYSFDAEGRQNGYAVYDRAGKLLGRTTPKTKPSSR